jgi:glycosyltransferase involved in cell wall biosynthesis
LPRDVDLMRQVGLDPDHHFVFGIVARLSEEKGHNYLLDAFAKVRAQREQARLVIVGDGPLDAAVRGQAKQLGLESSIVFAGQQRNIPSWLSIFDVFVLSSTRESFPLAAREAMAAGRAVIAPRIGGCPEVVDHGKTGLLFQAANSSDLSACMLAITEEHLHQRFGEAGRQRVLDRFSRRSWVDGDEAVYRRYLAA